MRLSLSKPRRQTRFPRIRTEDHALKIKVKNKDSRLIVQVRISAEDGVNERELDILSKGYVRGVLRVEYPKANTLTCTGPMAVSLSERLQQPIGKYEFFQIVMQLCEITERLRKANLSVNKIETNLDYIFINEQTKELHFLYVPLIADFNQIDMLAVIRTVLSTVMILREPGAQVVSQFSAFLSRLQRFDVGTVENTIQQLDRTAYNSIKRLAVGTSGYMTDKPKDYVDHYENKAASAPAAQQPAGRPAAQQPAGNYPRPAAQPAVTNYPRPAAPQQRPAPTPQSAQMQRPAPAPQQRPAPAPQPAQMQRPAPAPQQRPAPAPQPESFDVTNPFSAAAARNPYGQYDANENPYKAFSDDATDLLREEEEAQTALVDEDTGYEDEGADETALLVEPEPVYPTLTRLLTNEEIRLDKPVFRVGKEKSCVDFYIADNNHISRSHADFTTRDGRYYVTDLNSKNKTYLNGRMLVATVENELRDGDQLRLANEDFVFHIN